MIKQLILVVIVMNGLLGFITLDAFSLFDMDPYEVRDLINTK